MTQRSSISPALYPHPSVLPVACSVPDPTMDTQRVKEGPLMGETKGGEEAEHVSSKGECV